MNLKLISHYPWTLSTFIILLLRPLFLFPSLYSSSRNSWSAENFSTHLFQSILKYFVSHHFMSVLFKYKQLFHVIMPGDTCLQCGQHSRSNLQYALYRIVGVEQVLLTLLQIFIVRARQTFHRHHHTGALQSGKYNIKIIIPIHLNPVNIILLQGCYNGGHFECIVILCKRELFGRGSEVLEVVLTLPNNRPHFDRINSRLSKFFFCGIKLLPVLIIRN